MPSCCPLPRPPSKPPLCFLLLPLLRLPALCVLHGSLYFLRAESPLDPLKVGNSTPQGLVLQLRFLQAVGQPLVSFPGPSIDSQRPSKAHLRPTGWCGGVAPAVCGQHPQQGCPLKRAPTLTLAVGQGGKAQPFPPPGQCPPWAKSQGVRVVLPCGNLHPQVCPLDFWPRSP